MTHAPAKIYLPLIGELVAALAMLAILVLSFAPVTPANSILSSASASDTIATDASWCGDPLSGGRSAHAGACHACRYDAAALPEPPCTAESAFAAPSLVADTPDQTVQLPIRMVLAHGTRAPPHTV